MKLFILNHLLYYRFFLMVHLDHKLTYFVRLLHIYIAIGSFNWFVSFDFIPDRTAQGHYIPSGHLFRWVSSPHYLCEILIYLSLCLVVQWKNLYLVCATVFVICNQASASLSVHSWYRQTFKNYPKDRKAVLPYLL